jgi:hypothetical protein
MSTVPTVLPDPGARAPAQRLWTQEPGHEGAARTRAPWLIAPGRSLSVPRLDQVGLRHSSFGSDAAAARFATVLIQLGIGSPSDWTARGREPAKFLRRTLDRFVKSHAEPAIDGAFELSVTLSTAPHEWCETEDEPDGSQMFIYMEAASCGFVNLGPALTLCEKEDPRLPVTFARLFLRGLGRLFRIYDDRDAEEHLSLLEGSYDPEEEREALAALPDRKNVLPACMNRRPLGRRALKAILARMAPRSRVLRLLQATLELDRISRRVRLPEIPEPVREMFCDCNPPVPILLSIYQQGDAIETCFDDESQSMLEQSPEPWPLIPFNGTDPKSTKQAFGCLSGALETLAAARRVLELVPGWEAIRQERLRP